MRKLVYPNADIFYSSDFLTMMKHEVMLSGDKLPEHKLSIPFGDNPEGRTYCDLFARYHQLKPFGLLEAHGDGGDERDWYFYDGKKRHLVQSWIDRQDGKYGTLVLRVCNLFSKTPRSNLSNLCLVDNTFSEAKVSCSASDVSFGLVGPKGRSLDYVIEKEIEELTAALRGKSR